MPENRAVHAYLFEAKGVQRYLFASGRLRDVIGASDLVARIATSSGEADLIGAVLADLNLKTVAEFPLGQEDGRQVSFSRRAGSVFCLHGERETLIKVRMKMRQRVMLALPGLEISDALGKGSTEIAARDDAQRNASAIRANMIATILPMGRPVMAIAPQAGLPCTGRIKYGAVDEFLFDAVTALQRRRGDLLQKRMKDTGRGSNQPDLLDGVARRFHPDTQSEGLPVYYPRNLDPMEVDSESNPLFPFEGADTRIAYVHADLSGLGEGFANAKPQTAAAALALGKQVEDSVLCAVRETNTALIVTSAKGHSGESFRVAPARPIVIGGDDMTFIVRADLALRFTEMLLRKLEDHTHTVLGGLSACAGVAIVGKSLPFLTANALAESLCKHAKKEAKKNPREGNKGKWPSLFSFHMQTQTAEEDYGEDIVSTLTAPGERKLSANPYAVNHCSAKQTDTTEFVHLLALASAIETMPGCFGALRKIKGELANGRAGLARSLWRRIMTRPDLSGDGGTAFDRFRDELKVILGTDPSTIDVPNHGALFDALALVDCKALAITSDPTPNEVAQEQAA